MKTIRTGKFGKLILRLVEKQGTYFGLVIGAEGGREALIEGANADEVWRRLHVEAGRANPMYFGFDGARARFLRFFPAGFQSADFDDHERDYKVAAKMKLDKEAPLVEAASSTGFG